MGSEKKVQYGSLNNDVMAYVRMYSRSNDSSPTVVKYLFSAEHILLARSSVPEIKKCYIFCVKVSCCYTCSMYFIMN